MSRNFRDYIIGDKKIPLNKREFRTIRRAKDRGEKEVWLPRLGKISTSGKLDIWDVNYSR